VIERRQNDPREHHDLLALLMEARDAQGAGLSRQELRDEVLTFLLAGHETSALALTWGWYLLAQHPAVEGRLQAEAGQVLAGRAPGYADLLALGYTRAMIQEVLRLYPSSGVMVRSALAADQIGGWPVPAGAVIFLSQYVTHRLPEYWPEPEVFAPERFTGTQPPARPRYAYFPFGGGPRQCIGKDFALMEMQIILATLAQRFRLELCPGQRLDPRRAMDMNPRRPIWMRVRAR
jgi:cytochrome P450